MIIDGGSCHNLASKDMCHKLGLKYLPHPRPYHVQWLSDKEEVKVNYMVRVTFSIGKYTDTVDCDVVPMTMCRSTIAHDKDADVANTSNPAYDTCPCWPNYDNSRHQ